MASFCSKTIWRRGDAPRQCMTSVKTPVPSDFSWHHDACHFGLMHVTASRYAALQLPNLTMHQRSKIIVVLSRLLPRCRNPGYYAAIIILSACCVECVLLASNDTTVRGAASVYCPDLLSYCDITSICTQLLLVTVTSMAGTVGISPKSFPYYEKYFCHKF